METIITLIVLCAIVFIIYQLQKDIGFRQSKEHEVFVKENPHIFRKPTESHEGCPCNYGTPCHPQCTCVNKFSAYGCHCCCKYGSLEQRETSAKRIKSKNL